jgi:hypothetical protein
MSPRQVRVKDLKDNMNIILFGEIDYENPR